MENALKKYLDDHGLTVADLVRITGIPYMTIRNHALGTRKMPSLDVALAYEKKLGIPISAWCEEPSKKI